MATLPSLKGLQAFEAAARAGSFVAAAEELSISAAAVSQLIRTVEEQMGRKLFHRVNRRVVLTEAGVEMLPRLTMAFQEIGSVSREVSGGAFRPRLVVSVPPSMALDRAAQRRRADGIDGVPDDVLGRVLAVVRAVGKPDVDQFAVERHRIVVAPERDVDGAVAGDKAGETFGKPAHRDGPLAKSNPTRKSSRQKYSIWTQLPD